MGQQDRDYMRERKLDYRSKYDGRSVPGPYKEGWYDGRDEEHSRNGPPDLPQWLIWMCIGGALYAAFLIGRYWH